MELVLTRIAKRKTYTIGKLYIVEKVDEEMTEQREQSQARLSSAESRRNSNEIQYLAGEKQTYFCDTLEPTALELKTTVSKEAVLRSPTKTQKLKPFAIPEGRYALVITWSPKFFAEQSGKAERKMWLPVLLGGPDFNHLFKGIRIHMGRSISDRLLPEGRKNTAADTAGCILVGRNQIVGQLLESRTWLYELKQLIVAAKARDEAVWLTIK